MTDLLHAVTLPGIVKTECHCASGREEARGNAYADTVARHATAHYPYAPFLPKQ